MFSYFIGSRVRGLNCVSLLLQSYCVPVGLVYYSKRAFFDFSTGKYVHATNLQHKKQPREATKRAKAPAKKQNTISSSFPQLNFAPDLNHFHSKGKNTNVSY